MAPECADNLPEDLLAGRAGRRREGAEVAEPQPAGEAVGCRGVESRSLLAQLPVEQGRVPVALPVRMKVTPASASSASAAFPLGASAPTGGGFDTPTGNTRFPPRTSTPVGSIVTFGIHRG